MNKVNIDDVELKKISLNKLLFSINKKDHFEIEEVLKILNVDTLPIEIQLNNNQIFIRDISKYLVLNNLKPNIYKE